MNPYKIDFDALPWQSNMPGSRFKAFRKGNRQLRLLEFTDQFVETEWCRRDHIGMLLEGEMEIDFDGEVVVYKAGDGMFIPGGDGSKHKARVPSGTARMMLVEEA